MVISDVHVRRVGAGAGALIDGLAGPDDRLWPAQSWPRMRLDAGLRPGSQGGHGPVRYGVDEHVDGERVVFRFAPGFAVRGTHGFRLDGDLLVHELHGEPRGRMRLLWPLVLGPLHAALIEDALDAAERATTGGVRAPARWSARVRLLRPGPGCCAPRPGGAARSGPGRLHSVRSSSPGRPPCTAPGRSAPRGRPRPRPSSLLWWSGPTPCPGAG